VTFASARAGNTNGACERHEDAKRAMVYAKNIVMQGGKFGLVGQNFGWPLEDFKLKRDELFDGT